ncbi:cytochrome P450 [Lentinula aff. detonsa]|uniref:Cytochrome P450 n=1 Tax=Lentinula aff. detonsa TaxID=2804958 RepID=A0AA38KDZ8_9AGAR|nr:cytochrome P450 [Lentinula aff. detonsa]KAJ3796293.1 cytochrome P450 [Lentinula aff. detonsa]
MLPLLILFVTLSLIALSFRRSSRLDFLRGPKPVSYLLGDFFFDVPYVTTDSFFVFAGHEYEISHQSDAGQLEFEWVKKYGPTFRIFSCFSEDVLLIADPMGLQHIFQSQCYPKTRDIRLIAERVFGRGLLWATGETHQRHRRALNSAFSTQQLKVYMTFFQGMMFKLVTKWNDQLEENPAVLNMAHWMPKVTLDVIGQSAFDFNFGVLDGTAEYNELYRTMRDMFLDSKSSSPLTEIYTAVRRRLPERFGFRLYTTKEDRRFAAFLSAAQSTARSILLQKQEAEILNPNSDDKDIISVLIRTKYDDYKKRLSEEEIISQIATIILAGNETTSSTMSWMLYELSRNTESQARVHGEIASLRAQRGYRIALTSTDYDSMPYFNAVMKETLRLHPILPILIREADCDDTLPLSVAVRSRTGRLLSHVPIRKGQRIMLHLGAYNRLTQVWGDDADSWNPVRFLTEKKDVMVGVYGNLYMISGGIRSCIGWQFAVMELQVMLFELIESFEFSLPSEGVDIQRIPSILMVPMIRGKPELGVQLPLQVKQRIQQ